MDIYFFNSIAQAAALIVLMAIIFVLRKSIGSRSMFIGFEVLLLTVLLRRIDEIGMYAGYDIFDRLSLVILTWIVIFIFIGAFIRPLKSRSEVKHIESELKQHERYKDTLKTDRDTIS